MTGALEETGKLDDVDEDPAEEENDAVANFSLELDLWSRRRGRPASYKM